MKDGIVNTRIKGERAFQAAGAVPGKARSREGMLSVQGLVSATVEFGQESLEREVRAKL